MSQELGFGRFIKQYLSIFSDQSILSSIEIIDIKNRNILIRRDFWNLTLGAIKNFAKYRNFGQIIAILKQKWIERFCSISDSQMKKFFCGYTKNSFIDFLNVTRYVNDVAISDFDKFTETVKRATNSKNYRYAEIKGYKYYLYIKDNNSSTSSERSITTEPEDNVDNISISDPIIDILNQELDSDSYQPQQNLDQPEEEPVIPDDFGHFYDYIGASGSSEPNFFTPLTIHTSEGYQMEVGAVENLINSHSDYVEGQTFD